jgi:signal transduction histidine kinase
MKKLRWRYAIFLYLIIMFATLLAIFFSGLLKILIFPGTKLADAILVGFALREVLLPIILLGFTAAFIGAATKRMATPIINITNATKRIAQGDFDVRITETATSDEIGELQRNFNRMAKELKSNEYLKKDFVSNVSHEFKTPLSVIIGYAKLLEEDKITDADRKEYASQIVRESERLSNLTANILRLSKLDSQEIGEKPVQFLLDEQIRQCVLLLEPKWSKKQIEFNIELPSISFVGNEELLSQVWINLIENAVKFTHEKGEISVTMYFERGMAAVGIADSGIGMNEETRKRIFERFYQGDPSHAKEGNGLGLSIVKRIVELHGGKIDVESSLNAGTKFTVWLPLNN